MDQDNLMIMPYNTVMKTRTVAELAKHQGEKLVPTSEMLHIFVTIILLDDAKELEVIKKLYQLREYIFVF